MEKIITTPTKSKRLIATLVLLVGGMVILAVAVFPRALSFSTSNTGTVDSLSTRSKEFLQDQKEVEGSNWNYLSVDAAAVEPKPSSHTVQNSCFSTKISIFVQNPKNTDDLSKCSFLSTIPTPSSKLTITVESRTQSLNETSSVILRQRVTDEYSPVPFSAPGYSEALRFESKDSLVTFLRKDGYTVSIAFSSIARQSEVFVELSDEIIANLELTAN